MTRRALAAIVALMLIAPAVAAAKSSDDRGDRGGDRVPSAHLQASGNGTVTVKGRLAVTGFIPRRGTVVVVDRAGDAEVRLAGERVRLVRARARVRNASGLLLVTGSDVTVQVRGMKLALSIAGNGRARLAGRGVYRLNADATRAWRGGWIAIAPSSAARAAGSPCTDCGAWRARSR